MTAQEKRSTRPSRSLTTRSSQLKPDCAYLAILFLIMNYTLISCSGSSKKDQPDIGSPDFSKQPITIKKTNTKTYEASAEKALSNALQPQKSQTPPPPPPPGQGQDQDVKKIEIVDYNPVLNYRDAPSLGLLFSRIFKKDQSSFFTQKQQKNMGNYLFTAKSGVIYNSPPIKKSSINYLQTLHQVSELECSEYIGLGSNDTDSIFQLAEENTLAAKPFQNGPTLESLQKFMKLLLLSPPPMDEYLQLHIEAFSESMDSLNSEDNFKQNPELQEIYKLKRAKFSYTTTCVSLLTHPKVFTY